MERYHATSVLSLTARHPARAGQRSAALSTPQASPSDDREEHEMSGCKLVRVRADPKLPSRLIHCRVCKEPFAPTDGEYVLKYFLVDKTKKHNGIDLRMNHPPEDECRSRG